MELASKPINTSMDMDIGLDIDKHMKSYNGNINPTYAGGMSFVY